MQSGSRTWDPELQGWDEILTGLRPSVSSLQKSWTIILQIRKHHWRHRPNGEEEGARRAWSSSYPCQGTTQMSKVILNTPWKPIYPVNTSEGPQSMPHGTEELFSQVLPKFICAQIQTCVWQDIALCVDRYSPVCDQIKCIYIHICICMCSQILIHVLSDTDLCVFTYRHIYDTGYDLHIIEYVPTWGQIQISVVEYILVYCQM